jgi:putative thioredoxin
VLVDFWAPWCGPCRQLTPVLEKTVRAAKGKVKLVKMNIDDHPAIPGQMGIQSIPAVIAFVNGQPADGFMGALPESQVVAFLERLTKGAIGGEAKDLLKAADAALAEGDAAGAATLYAELLAEDNGNVQALAGLARSYVKTGALDQARQTLAMVPTSKANDAAVVAARAALDLAEQAKTIGPLADLEQKVAANPLDHQARFDLAVALNAKGRRGDALDHLITIVKRDRKWNDDGARKQLVQFFDAWGPTDEATIEGRKRLSSILFA